MSPTMDSHRADDNDDEILECVYCQRLATDAVLLPCIHTACRACLTAAAAAAAAASPTSASSASATASSPASSDGLPSPPVLADGAAPSAEANGHKDAAANAAANAAAAAAAAAAAPADDRGGVSPAPASPAAEVNGSAFSPRGSLASEPNSLGDSLNSSATSTSTSSSRRSLCPRCPDEPATVQRDGAGDGSGSGGGLAATVKTNRHVSGRIKARNSATAQRSCTFCDEAGAAGEAAAAAAHRCCDCGKFLCETCRAFHGKLMKQHRVVALDEFLSDEAAAHELELAGATACSQHGRELAFTCASCRDFKCVTCVAACDTDGHRYMTLAVSARNARERVAALLPGLDERLAALAALDAENERRAAAHETLRAGLTDALQRNKRSLLDMAGRAFEAARRDADERLDAALAAGGAVGELAGQLRGGIRRVGAYVRSLLDGGDPLSLVDQADVLADCVAALLRRASTLAAADEVKLHVVNASLPNMADIVSYHVGQIRASSADSSPSAAGGGAHSRSSSQDGVGGGRGVGELTLVTPFTFTAPDGSRVAFALQHVVSYKADMRCLDVAVGFDGGTILVSEKGIRRYDVGGRQLSVARPECEYGSVTSHNGHRFAAWNYTRQKVEIFNRDGQVADALKALGRVAVAEDGKLAAANGAGVTLFDADGQQLLHVDYSAHNDGGKWLPPVAVRHRSLVLALQPPTAGGGSAVVAFDYQGRQRWRVNVDEPVYGLCCDGWGNVFAALHDSGAVRALAADGRPLGDVLAAAHGLGKPWRVAVSGDSRWLAVLAADKLTVAIYANLIHVT